MASHWACNMSPLGRAGAPALRAESAAPSARREHGVLDHRQTSSDSANSANSVRRSLEQGRARRQADPLTDPGRILDGPLTDPRRTSFFILASEIAPKPHLRAHPPYPEPSSAHLSPVFAHRGPSWPQLGPSWAQLGPSWAELGPSHGPLSVQKLRFPLGF